MKTKMLALGLTAFLPACVQVAERHPTSAPTQQVRVSDSYSRKAVKSYEVFHADIDDHAIILVRLTTGQHFPMLCRKTDNGIHPIPQSVFAEQGAERWSVMCEPHVRHTYSLMRLELSRVDGVLFMGGRKLAPSAKVPLLARPS